jgi:DNA repair exonuclease SbcCD ATPase subunit
MENFGPYKEPMMLQIKNNTLVLIVGPNGVGKTMMIDAIPFTLYGTTSKEMKGDDVVNNVVGKNCHTWLEFETNGSAYRIDRYQKYQKMGNNVTLKRGNDLTLIKNGQNEVLPEIEKLVCSYKSFMNTIMFGQKVKDFFTDLVDSKKKEIFRKILNLDKYTDYYNETNKRLSAISTEIETNAHAVNIQLAMIDDSKKTIVMIEDSTKKFYADKEQRIKTVELENNEILSEIGLLERQTEELKIKFEGSYYSIDELENLKVKTMQTQKDLELKKGDIIRQRDQKISELKEQALNKRNALIEEKSNKEKKYNDQVNYLNKLRDEQVKAREDLITNIDKTVIDIQGTIRYEKERAKEILTKVIESPKAECPLCETKVVGETKKLLENKVKTYLTNVSDLEPSIERHNSDKKKIQKQILEIKTTFENDKQKLKNQHMTELNEIEAKLLHIKEKLNELFQQVNEMANNNINTMTYELNKTLEAIGERVKVVKAIKEENEKVKLQHDTCLKRIENFKLKQQYNNQTLEKIRSEAFDNTQINYQQQRIHNAHQTINNTNKILNKCANDSQVLEFWKQAFSPSGIPSMLIDESIPFMNSTISEILDLFTNGRYIVSFDTLSTIKSGEYRDKISVNVLDTQTRANSRIQLSGGQTRLIDIATILTLGELQSKIQMVKFNILLFDEIFDSLDEENINNVGKILSKLKSGRTIFIISHKHPDQLDADETINLM